MRTWTKTSISLKFSSPSTFGLKSRKNRSNIKNTSWDFLDVGGGQNIPLHHDSCWILYTYTEMSPALGRAFHKRSQYSRNLFNRIESWVRRHHGGRSWIVRETTTTAVTYYADPEGKSKEGTTMTHTLRTTVSEELLATCLGVFSVCSCTCSYNYYRHEGKTCPQNPWSRINQFLAPFKGP